MRLRRSVLSGAGITRIRRGKGFSYCAPDGEPLVDDASLSRIKDLVIPPAWKKVWISPSNGHIQAVGTAAGAASTCITRNGRKSVPRRSLIGAGVVQAAAAWRAHIADDLKSTGLKRIGFCLGVAPADRGYFRAGGEQYAEENVLRHRNAAMRTCHAAVERSGVRLSGEEWGAPDRGGRASRCRARSAITASS